MSLRFFNPVDSKLCYKILSEDSTQFLTLIYSKMWHKLVVQHAESMRWAESASLDTIIILLLGNGNPLVPHNFKYSKSFEKTIKDMSQIQADTIYDEVVKCGKSVIIFNPYVMRSKFNDMSKKYFPIKFYKGKDILNIALGGLTFEGGGNSKVPQYFQSLIESGIQARLDSEWATRGYSRKAGYTMPEQEYDRVRLGGAILTRFILYGVLIGSSMLIWILS